MTFRRLPSGAYVLERSKESRAWVPVGTNCDGSPLSLRGE